MNKIGLLKKRHNRIVARIKHGHDKPGDKDKLEILKRQLGYK